MIAPYPHAMLRRSIYAFVAVVLLAWPAALSATALSDQDLVGLWYGEGYQPTWDTEAEWLVERHADGTFRAEYRIRRQCQIEFEQIETGIWWVVGSDFITLTEKINGNTVYVAPHTYRVTARRGDTIEYLYVEGNVPYKAKRVQERLSRPACLS
jgi:hypothetical protein